jgi:hypothetical protein
MSFYLDRWGPRLDPLDLNREIQPSPHLIADPDAANNLQASSLRRIRGNFMFMVTEQVEKVWMVAESFSSRSTSQRKKPPQIGSALVLGTIAAGVASKARNPPRRATLDIGRA